VSEFHHHPDDKIFVRTDTGVYRATVAEFATDITTLSLSSYPGLPEEYDERFYDPAGKHELKNRKTAFPQSSPWALGDEYISNYADLKAEQDEREE